MALTKPSDKMLAPGSSLTLATMQASTSGTSIDFTGIPAGTKEIRVMFSGVSTNGAGTLRIQIGDSGGLETSGYTSIDAGATDAALATALSLTTGFSLRSASAGNTMSGVVTLTLMDAATNLWVAQGSMVNTAGTIFSAYTTGVKALSATLDRLSVNTSSGDTFDAGSINIAYK